MQLTEVAFANQVKSKDGTAPDGRTLASRREAGARAGPKTVRTRRSYRTRALPGVASGEAFTFHSAFDATSVSGPVRISSSSNPKFRSRWSTPCSPA